MKPVKNLVMLRLVIEDFNTAFFYRTDSNLVELGHHVQETQLRDDDDEYGLGFR